MGQERFGRIHAPDPRDKRFMLRKKIKVDFSNLPHIRHWVTGKVLDQGDTPYCVEYSGRQWLSAHPVFNAWNEPTGTLYHECQKNDEWDGEDYDGTSVRALFKVLQNRGYVKSYGWAFDNDTATAWILQNSPMVFGTDWYSDMMEIDKHGFIHATGTVEGGHAYLIHGTNRRKRCPDGSIGAHRIINSWGKAFGDGGYAWISYVDMERLISNNGECATAIELKL